MRESARERERQAVVLMPKLFYWAWMENDALFVISFDLSPVPFPLFFFFFNHISIANFTYYALFFTKIDDRPNRGGGTLYSSNLVNLINQNFTTQERKTGVAATPTPTIKCIAHRM